MVPVTVETSSVYELSGWLWYFLMAWWRFTDLGHLLESLSRCGLYSHFMSIGTENGKLSPYQNEIPSLKTGENILSEYRGKCMLSLFS